jgi:hypothetical protein
VSSRVDQLEFVTPCPELRKKIEGKKKEMLPRVLEVWGPERVLPTGLVGIRDSMSLVLGVFARCPSL